MAVSYTHLDVYKRQVHGVFGGGGFGCAGVCGGGGRGCEGANARDDDRGGEARRDAGGDVERGGSARDFALGAIGELDADGVLRLAFGLGRGLGWRMI